jgi:hypothetical protein
MTPQSAPNRPAHEVLATSTRRSEWGWCGFGAGLLGYVVLSSVFGTLPEERALTAVWAALGLVPAGLGLCVGLTLARVVD